MTMINGLFIWWHVIDGVAIALPDTPEVSAAIDAGTLNNIFGSIEGAILHGGVIATAFSRVTSDTFEALAFLERGEMVRAGSVTVTRITAERATP